MKISPADALIRSVIIAAWICISMASHAVRASSTVLSSEIMLDSVDIHTKMLQSYYDRLNKGLYALIQVRRLSSESSTPMLRYRLKPRKCDLYDNLDLQIPLTDVQLDVDDLYQKIEEDIDHILLSNGDLQFWIERSCTEEVIQNPNSAENFQFQEEHVEHWLKMVEMIKQSQDELYRDVTSYLKKNKQELQNASNKDYKLAYVSLVNNIEAKRKYVVLLHDRLTLHKKTTKMETYASPLQRLRIRAHALFGASNFNKNFNNGTSNSINSGNTDIDVQATYLLDEQSSLQANIRSLKTTQLASSSSNMIGLGYKTKRGQHRFGINGDYKSYDDLETNSYDYNVTQLRGSLEKRSPDKFNYGANYQFFDQKYSQNETNSYSRHNLNGAMHFSNKKGGIITTGINILSGSSDNDFLNYTSINPSLNIEKNSGGKRSNLLLEVERIDFTKLESRTNDRYRLSYQKNVNKLSGGQKSANFGLVMRDFPNDDTRNYLDLSMRTNRYENSHNNKSKTSLMRVRYNPNYIEASHLDIRRGVSKGTGVRTRYDVNIRMFYPSNTSQVTKMDLFYKLTFPIAKQLHFGPFVGYHLLFDFKNPPLSITDDKNAFQYGMELSGALRFSSKVRCNIRGSYDFNTVYNTNLEDRFETIVRNPSNLQFSGDLSYKVHKDYEVFVRANYFSHETDFLLSNSDALSDNNSLRFNFGLRMRYN